MLSPTSNKPQITKDYLKTEEYKKLPMSEKRVIIATIGGLAKRGHKLQRTLNKETVQKDLERKIQKNAFKLFHAAMIPALGQIFIYKIEEEVTGSGPRGGEYKKRKHTLVESPDEIRRALDCMDGAGQGTDYENDSIYYYVTTKEPDHKAIQMLLDRGFGKPKETIDGTLNIQFSLRGLADKRKALNGEDVDVEIKNE